MAKEKSRYFTFLLYPESLPEDWLLKLELVGVPMAISPLHDRDLSNREGEKYKKPHYHVIYIAANPVTAQAVRNKIQRALGKQSVALVQIIATSVENTYLYLTHESKDAVAKNKRVYDKAEIVHLNNFDLDRYIMLDISEKKNILRAIKNFIMHYKCRNIVEFEDAYNLYGQEFGLPSIAQVDEVIDGYSGVLRLYFDGVYQSSQYQEVKTSRVIRKENDDKEQIIDQETGEIIES